MSLHLVFFASVIRVVTTLITNAKETTLHQVIWPQIYSSYRSDMVAPYNFRDFKYACCYVPLPRTIIKTAWATAGAVLWNSLPFTDIQLLRKWHLQLKIAGWFPPTWHLLKNRIKFCYEYFVLQTRAGAHHWHHLFPVEHSRWYEISFHICIANAWCLQPLKMKMVQIRGGRRGRVENRSPGQKLVARGPLIRGRVDFHYRVIFTCVHTYILPP